MNKKIDVFPAILWLAPPDSLEDWKTLPMSGPRPQQTRKVDRARVALFQGKMFVAVDSPEGPKLVFREQIADYLKDPDGKSHHVLLASGKIEVFRKDHNCGCGSRLRSWNPFGNHLYSTDDPDS